MIRGGVKEMRVLMKVESLKRKLKEADALVGKLALSPHPDAEAALKECLPEARELRERAMESLNKAYKKLGETK